MIKRILKGLLAVCPGRARSRWISIQGVHADSDP